jgi:hypothetical protein
VASRYAPASEEAKSDHDVFLDRGDQFAYGSAVGKEGSAKVPWSLMALALKADHPQWRVSLGSDE